MSNGKVFQPYNIPIEVWEKIGHRGIVWITELFNGIMRTKKISDEWKRRTLIPI